MKLATGLKKDVRNVAREKYGFVELIVILFTLNKRCDFGLTVSVNGGLTLFC